MSKTIGLEKHIGQKFVRLTVIGVEAKIEKGHRRYKLVCQCDCGEITSPNHEAILNGDTRSCGCLKVEKTIERMLKHGHGRRKKHSLTFKTWKNMRDRCLNENRPEYKNYGGRGVVICYRWHEFKNFLEDMGERPSKKHSIDRIDVNGNYEPSNCRWATQSQQIINRRPKGNKSGHVGITIIKNKDKTLSYRAAIITRQNGVLKNLFCKNFRTLEEAIVARKKADIELRG